MTLATFAKRLDAAESRIRDLEGSETIYKLHRSVVGVQLDLRKLLAAANLTPATDAEIDAVLDES
jgi:hypothetical protein